MTLNRLKEIKDKSIYDANVQKELADYMKTDQKFFTVAKNKAQETESNGVGMLDAIQIIDLAIDYLTNPDKYKEVKAAKTKKKVEKKVESKPVKDIFSLGL